MPKPGRLNNYPAHLISRSSEYLIWCLCSSSRHWWRPTCPASGKLYLRFNESRVPGSPTSRAEPSHREELHGLLLPWPPGALWVWDKAPGGLLRMVWWRVMKRPEHWRSGSAGACRTAGPFSRADCVKWGHSLDGIAEGVRLIDSSFLGVYTDPPSLP